ncbi:hypothetical protein M378DRAFT_16082 [Amanita muscaria Koide BX008]|uniref:Uncharacterized protein n=1 Tax=Amanita muscaria (strain Koide BX008) TaxID=946122 RepID=A0A0C2SUD5_AMAMK|nr:hypothetical protein M378DRAFT_16082 [Amanita muscaria Koide BX008]
MFGTSSPSVGLIYDALYTAICIPSHRLPPSLFTTNGGREEKTETRIELRTFRYFLSEIAAWARDEKIVLNGLTQRVDKDVAVHELIDAYSLGYLLPRSIVLPNRDGTRMDITKDEVLTLSESLLVVHSSYSGLKLATPILALSVDERKLASGIVTGTWEVAQKNSSLYVKPLTVVVIHHLTSLLTSTSSHVVSGHALAQLHSRTWLMHWFLFVYFSHSRGRTLLFDLATSTQIKPPARGSCATFLLLPFFLARQTALGSPPTEEYQYQDPKALNEAVDVVENAFFFGEFKDDILDDARYLISVRRLISDLSERLNLTRDEGEKWIVNLIRETRMGADVKNDLEKVILRTFLFLLQF